MPVSGARANSKSVRRRILEEIRQTLSEIKIANQFENDLVKVEELEENELTITEFPVCIINPSPEQKTFELAPVEAYTCILPIEVSVWFEYSEGALVTKAESWITDVLIALMQNFRRDGGNPANALAVDTVITEPEIFVAANKQPFGGVTMVVSVHYRHDFKDPTVIV